MSSPSAHPFELPVLARLDPLTAGTNLPSPPADTPVEKTAAQPTPSSGADTSDHGKENSNAARGLMPGSYHSSGNLGRTAAAGDASDGSSPTSPISPKRPSSIRRFLSHRSLRSRYSNASQENLAGSLAPVTLRPDTSIDSYYSTASGPTKTTSRAAKRSSSWFGRFTAAAAAAPPADKKRTSIVYEEKLVVKSPSPRLPEFGHLQTKIEAGSLGAEDMFKNIK